MSCDPEEFLGIAVEMAADNREVVCRNAISRAYYAAFHEAVRTFKGQENAAKEDISRTGLHKRFIEQLSQGAAGSPERRVGVWLGTLHRRRIVADYRLADPVQQVDVANQINRAKDVLKLCKEVSVSGAKEPPVIA